MSIRERWLPICLAGAFVCLMALASQLTGCDEILFPETAAILCGAWVQPHQAWNVDRPRMMLLMGSGAIMGLCLNLLVPGPIWARAVLGYACCALAMNGLGADMTPMVSAVILPVLLGTRDWAYPVTVIVLVGVICLGQMALERWGLRERIDFKPLRPPARQALHDWGARLGVFALLSAPAYFSGNPLLAAPPLLVTYTEFTRPDMTLRLKPRRAWGTLALAGLFGGVGRFAVESLGVPPTLFVALFYPLLIATWSTFETWLPPAGAVLLLGLLVPYAGPLVYPASVAVGGAVWVTAAMAFPGIRPKAIERGPLPARGHSC